MMAKASTKKPTTKKTTLKKSTKPKAEMPETVVASAVVETPVAELQVAVQSEPVAVATVPTEPAPAKPKPRPKVSRTLKKGLVGTPALLEVVRFMAGAYGALKDINCRFDGREKSGVENVKRFGMMQAKIELSGGHADPVQVARTIRLATTMATEFDARFEGIMQDSFTVFDKELREVERIIPDIRARDGDKIVVLQDALRAVLAKPDADYDETIDAYNAMMAYLPSVSKLANDIVNAERERQRSARRIAVNEALMAELEGLEID